MLAYASGFFAMLLGNVLFLTSVWEYSTLRAGLAVTPAPILAALLAAPSGRFASAHGYRSVIVPGSLLTLSGMVWLATVTGDSPDVRPTTFQSCMSSWRPDPTTTIGCTPSKCGCVCLPAGRSL